MSNSALNYFRINDTMSTLDRRLPLVEASVDDSELSSTIEISLTGGSPTGKL